MNIKHYEMLEKRVNEVIELGKSLRGENYSLTKELDHLRANEGKKEAEIEKKEREIRALKEQIKALFEKRKEAAARVKGLMEELDILSP